MSTILDFHIRRESDEGYGLEVFNRSKSQPLASTKLDYPLSFMTEFELGLLDFDEKAPLARMERLKAFGNKLYSKLFAPEVLRVWEDYKNRSEFLVLCIRIAPDVSGLETLPWEALFDGEEFISAGAKTGMSRLPLDVEPQDELPLVPRPLKMLAFIASPLDLKENERLQIEREQEILLQAVNTPAGQGRLQADFEDEAKLDILEGSLEAKYQILHYTGHGISPANGGGLLLEDAQGNRRPTAVSEILHALEKGENSLQLAVISGCQTARTLHVTGFRDLARGLARRKIPAVIAMQFSISDRAGLAFAEAFYPRIALGQPLEEVLSIVRRLQLRSEDPYLQADALAPVLISANGECLKTTEAEQSTNTAQPVLDLSFHLLLPQLSFGFYGRRKEYRQIRDGLLYQNHRAIIAYGIGGIGKTALASYAANRLRRHFKGVYAFDCSGGTLAPERIMLKLHEYFQLQGVNVLEKLLFKTLPPEVLANYLSQILSQWPLLIIFDNFESQLEQVDSGFQIADEGLRTFVTTLVKTTAIGSRFLFTSRYLFDLDSKRLGNIQELALGDLNRPEALGLMQKLPRLREASFDDKLAAFKTFGGHPYALVVLDRHCGYRSLSDTLTDAKSVHTELREFLAIELSYGKLSEDGRELLNRLSAFREPVPTDAAVWVMGKKVSYAAELLQTLDRNNLPDEWKVLDDADLLQKLDQVLPERRKAENLDKPIIELISWGLLTPIYEEGQLSSLAVHSLVRDFCCDKQTGEKWVIRLCDAAAFYTNLTKLLQQDKKSQAVVWSEMEAFEILMEAEDYHKAAAILFNADPILNRWGFGHYLESQYHRLLSKVGHHTRAYIVHNLGIVLQNRGKYKEALARYEEALKIEEELGDRSAVASSLHQIGFIHQERGEYKEALARYKEPLKIEEELGNRSGVAKSLHHIGIIHQVQGEYKEALVRYEESEKIFKELDDRSDLAELVLNIGIIHQDQGELNGALMRYEESEKIFREFGNLFGRSKALHNIGFIHQERGEYKEALARYKESLKISEELGIRSGIAFSHGQLGQFFTVTGRFEAALEHSLSALSICIELQSPNAELAIKDLKNLRAKWGADNFDAAWKKATGQDLPEWLR
jgi:tetratricopeptide (TPR) repeat protein